MVIQRKILPHFPRISFAVSAKISAIYSLCSFSCVFSMYVGCIGVEKKIAFPHENEKILYFLWKCLKLVAAMRCATLNLIKKCR